MENPFEIINQRLERIEVLLQKLYEVTNVTKTGVAISPIMTLKLVSAYLDLSLSALYKMTSNRDIPHSKRGKRLYFNKAEIDTWVLEHKRVTNDDIEKMASEYIQRNPSKFS